MALSPDHQSWVLALRVYEAMHVRGWRIPTLAREAALPLSTVQKIVKGASKQPSVWTIARLAATLGLSMDYLVGLTNDKHPSPSSPLR